MIEFSPWQRDTWDALNARRRADRLPHALLLSGPRGLGKNDFARLFAQALLCEQPAAQGLPCGRCRGCLLYAAGNHPDYTRVAPEEEGKGILIDRIRALGPALAITSQYGGYKVAVITPAERMNTAAANALLKTLEEPTPRTVLLLVTDRPAALLPTIRSRCQQVAFPTPAEAVSLPWLQARLPQPEEALLLLRLADGAPLLALALAAEDVPAQRRALFADLDRLARTQAHPSGVAEKWGGADLKKPLHWLASWTMDTIRLKLAAQPPHLVNTDLAQGLQGLAERVDLKAAFDFLDRVTEARRLADTSVNPQLLLEDLVIGWHGLAARRT